jgi:thiol-disulfide isomerase/thioredoxin
MILHSILRRALLAAFLGGAVCAQPPQTTKPTQAASPTALDNERQDLTRAVQQAGPSSVDFIRALERHLQKYPDSQMKLQIDRALFRAAKETHDEVRIAKYGEALLAADPNDISLLEDTAKAMNSFGDPELSAKALDYGKKFETLVRQDRQRPETDTANEDAKQQLEQSRRLGSALLIQADATGIPGNFKAAADLARKSFEHFAQADAARSTGRWLAKLGDYDGAIPYYADAFALADTAEAHASDRRRLTELYLKTHPTQSGLGDIVLAAYDRMTAMAAERNQLLKIAAPSTPIEYKLAGLDGKTLALDSLKGKVVVMDFWATWCGPCRQQHPLFEKVKAQFKSDPRVTFLEINNDDDSSVVAPFLEQHNWDRNVYLAGNLAETLNIQSIPTTVLLGRDGNVYSKMIGFNPESFAGLLTSRIQDALSETSAPAAQAK